MSEWRPYFIRRKSSPSMSQSQIYQLSPSVQQASHFFTEPQRIHGPSASSYNHPTGSNNVWPGDQWVIQPGSGLRSRPASDYNVAPSVPYDHQSYVSYPASESERVVWVHQDFVAPQQEYSNPTAPSNRPQYVRVISSSERFRERPEPYPLQGSSHSSIGSSSSASPGSRYHLQPTSAPPTIPIPDRPLRQVLTDNTNQHAPMTYASSFQEGLHSSRTEKDNSMSRRQRSHLDSERKRRE
jgi:hypothetical protein